MIRALIHLAEDSKPPGLSWVEYAAAIAGLLISLGVIFGGLTRLFNKGLEKKIQEGVNKALETQTAAITKAVVEATKPIHPEANGGFSLPDVAKTVAKVDSKLDDVISDISEIRVQTSQNAAGLSEVRRMERENTSAINQRLDEATEQRAAIGDLASKLATDINDENQEKS